MGASVSRNATKVVNKVVAKVSSKIIQDTKLSENQNQLISVKNIDGDVFVIGNRFYQNAYINVKVLMDALSSQEAQNDIMMEISQEAKSMIKGLNIFQVSVADNSLDILIDAMINISTQVSQVCLAQYDQFQRIVVERVKGNVYIQNNVFDQVADILFSCVQQVVSENKAINDLKEKLDQQASAKAEGLSSWVIIGIFLIIIGVPVGGVVLGGKAILKYLFPILVIFGIGLLVAYALYTHTDMKYVDFSKLISSTSVCLGQSTSTTTQFQSVARANEACMNSKDCVALDWHVVDTTKNPPVPIDKPRTTIYSRVDSGCSGNIAQDNVPTLRVGRVFSGPINPTSSPTVKGSNGDVYVNTTSSAYFRVISNRWVYERDVVADTSKIRSLTVSDKKPTLVKGVDGDYYVYYNRNSPIYLFVYAFVSGKGWVQAKDKVRGPGLVPNVPSASNISGFKVQIHKPWLMYTGITAVVVGLIGTAVSVHVAAKKKQ